MKTSKTISFFLALCMILSVLIVGAVSASAAEENTAPAEVADDAPTEVAEATEEATEEATDEETEESVDIDDSRWIPGLIANYELTDEEDEMISSLTEGLYDENDYFFLPVQVIATQTVAGTNYAFLCDVSLTQDKFERDTKNMTPAEKEEYEDYYSEWMEIYTVYVDTQGKAKLLNSSKVDLDDLKTLENLPEQMDGAWVSTAKPSDIKELENAVKTAINNYDGIKLDVIGELGYNASVTKRLVMCYGTTVTADPRTDLYIVEVHGEYEGETAEITKVSVFDLSAYVKTEAVEEESTEAPTEEATEKAPEKPDNTEKSPNTGYPVGLVTLFVFIAIVCIYASYKAILNKNT